MKISGLSLAQGEVIPWYQGIAYYSPYSDHVVCYPVPFNCLVRWGRALWWQLQRTKPDLLAQAYSQGQEDERARWRKRQEEDREWAERIIGRLKRDR